MKLKARLILNAAKVLMVVLLIVSFAAVSHAATLSDVTPLLEKLESAYNRNDLQGIAECYAYDFSAAYKIAEKVTGVDSSIIEGLMPFMNNFMSLQAEQSGTRPKCKLTPVSYTGDDYAGLLKYNVLFTYADGRTDQYDTEMDIKKYNSEWRIDLFQKSAMSQYLGNRNYEEDSFVYPDVTEDDFKKRIMRVSIPSKYKYSSTKLMRFVNEDGKTLFQDYYEDYKGDYDGYIAVRKDGKWGFINHYGQKMTEFCFWYIDYADNGYWKVTDQNGRGLINLKTGEGFACTYDSLGSVCNGYIPAQKGDLWGILDVNGKSVSGFKYTGISEKARDGLLIVNINKATGLIDYKGKELIKPSVEMGITDIINSKFIRVWKNDAHYICDTAGKELFQCDSRTHIVSEDVLYYHKEFTSGNDTDIFLNSKGKQTKIYKALQSQISSMGQFYIYPETYDGEWMEIQYQLKKEGKSYSSSYYYNFINTKGELKYREEMPISKDTYVFRAAGNKHIYVYDGQLCVVDCNNDEFIQYPVSGILPITGIGCMKGLFGPDKMVFSGDGSPAILDLNEMKAYQFYDIECYPGPLGLFYSKDYEAESLTVTDGAYYGLVTKKGLIGKGIAYITIKNWGECGTISEGDQETDIFIGTNGNVCIVENNKNKELKAVPLEESGLKAVKLKGTTTKLTPRSDAGAEKKETAKKETAAAKEDKQSTEAPAPSSDKTAAEPAESAKQETPAQASPAEQSTPVPEKKKSDKKTDTQQDNSKSKKEEAAGTWTCENCGQTGNTENFCPHCGQKAPEPSITMTITSFSGTARLVKSKINLRAQPIQTGMILHVLTDTETEMDVIGHSVDAEGTEWYQVVLADHSMGFIRGDLLTFVSGSKKSSSEKKDSSKEPYKTVTIKDGVVMRQEPRGDSKRVTTIADANTTVKVYDTAYDDSGTLWYYVKAKGKYGYIRGDLLK